MQYIVHEEKNIIPIMDELETLYKYTSDRKPKPALFPQSFDKSVLPIIDFFDTYTDSHYDVNIRDEDLPQFELPKDIPAKAVVVCFSGGKDCIATTLYYKELGYKVYLYHVKGIKWAYPVDYKFAEKVAEHLGLPFYTETVKRVGKYEWQIDHPMSRMMILNRALSFAIKNKLAYKVATGDFLTSYLDDVPFEINAADTIDMNRCYEGIIKKFIPKFELLIHNTNYHTAFEVLAERKDMKLLELLISCASIHKWRDYWNKRISEKFGIKLMPHRCGLCYKCCSEYLYFCDHNMLEFNRAYYLYCLQRLLTLWETEFTKELPDDIQSLWDTWLFYDISESKMYPEILDIEIRGKKLHV